MSTTFQRVILVVAEKEKARLCMRAMVGGEAMVVHECQSVNRTLGAAKGGMLR
jgi:hypothetical protein